MAKKNSLMSAVTAKVKEKKMKPMANKGSLMKKPGKMEVEVDGSRNYLAGLSHDHARAGFRSLGSAGATSSDKMVPGQEQMQKVASSLDQVAKKPKA